MRKVLQSSKINLGSAQCVPYLARYLSLLHAKAEGRSEAEMANEICRSDPQIAPARARRLVKSGLKRAQWLADNPQYLLGAPTPPAPSARQRNKVK